MSGITGRLQLPWKLAASRITALKAVRVRRRRLDQACAWWYADYAPVQTRRIADEAGANFDIISRNTAWQPIDRDKRASPYQRLTGSPRSPSLIDDIALDWPRPTIVKTSRPGHAAGQRIFRMLETQ